MHNRCSMKRAILALAAAVGLASAGSDRVDEIHPRTPGTPLEILFTPWRCTRCVEEGILPAEEEKPISMLRMPVDELIKKLQVEGKWIAIQTPHFKILSTLHGEKVKPSDSVFYWSDFERLKAIFPKITAGLQGTVLDPHERAHLYHVRMERLYAHFAALTAIAKPHLGMGAAYELYLFEKYADHHSLVDQFIGKSNDKAGVQHHDRGDPNFMMFTHAAQQVPGGDRQLNNTIFHNVAHNLADGAGNYYRETPAWLEEGLAHYYERREATSPNTFCWTEGKAPTMFQKPDWKSTILNIVRRGKDAPLGQWCEKLQPGELSGEEQGLSWSIVEWMIATDPIRFAKIFDRIDDTVEKPTASQCIEYAFGVTPNVLHARWQEYVRTEYAKK